MAILSTVSSNLLGRQFIIFILLLIGQLASGQKDFAEIKGTVISSSNLNDTDFVKDAEITLKIGDSVYVRQFTNEKGEYSFLVKKIKRSAQIEIHPVKKTRSVKRKHKCYLNSKCKLPKK